MLLRIATLFAVAAMAFVLFQRRALAEGLNVPANDGLGSGPDPRPRGIRNNNPTNIDDVGIPWKGRIGNDGRYVVFDSPVNGLRAGFLEIYDSIVRDGDNTIRKLVAQWAPPIENLTGSYQLSVANQTGIGIDSVLSYKVHAMPILKAIVRHENGQNPYPDSMFAAAYREAGKEL